MENTREKSSSLAPRATRPIPPLTTPATGAEAPAAEPDHVGGTLSIPQLIHQSWRDDGFPKTMFNWRWQAGLQTLNPGWKLMR